MREYESVKRWLEAKDYKEVTIHKNLQYLATWCGVLHLDPDELAQSEQLETRDRLEEVLKKELGYKDKSVTVELSVLHQFWRANGKNPSRKVMERSHGKKHA